MPVNSVFIDSNVLVYSVSDEGEKSKIAQNILASHDIIISVQVLNEFCNVTLRKKILSLDEVAEAIKTFDKSFTILSLDSSLVAKALQVKQRFGYSYYDSLIIATALSSGVTILYSEDMQNTQTIDGQLTIINPFKTP